MSYVNPSWLEGHRKRWQRHDWQRWIRHDARRFVTPAGIAEEKRAAEAEKATRRKAEAADAAEHEAGATFMAELEALRADHERVSIELTDVKFALALRRIFHKYSPDQPRVPAGNPDGGQWTGGSGESAPRPNTAAPSDEPLSSFPASAPSYENVDGPGLKPILIQMTGDTRPVYDKADSALLAPKGINATSSEQKLRYILDDDGRYLGGVTVVNEDRTAVGRLIESINRAPVNVRFSAQIQTADGISTATFEIRKGLSPGNSVTIPWKEFGLMKGPGQVEVAATNLGSLYTVVIIGARRAP